MRHWADHCASCHGNDGKGDTAMGRGLYPRAPDMTLAATQDLSDGELFWIIENGIKLTGMPAWGSASEEESNESWGLVRFIRQLPEISQSELRQMRRFNPISREEVERQQEIERFLAGGPEPQHAMTEEHQH
jgi:mono/diheme cytochrome c family protein